MFVGDGVKATNSATDPDFCCWSPSAIPDCPPLNPPAYPGCDTECGPGGCGTLWYKFVAPDAISGPTSSVQLSTCGSNFPADNSMIQVFSIPDSDRGKCRLDLSACSVSAQDCADGSECVFDEEFACANLSPVACVDDTPGCSSAGGIPQPRNSRMCVTGLIPGDLYYVMISAKAVQTKADYRLQITANCGVTRPPIPNDLCGSAAPLTGAPLSVPFDLSGGETYAPVTFDCPGPMCLEATLHNDIWFDWTAPASGTTTFSTCGGSDANTPDTGLVVYNGCDCPVSDADVLGCNDFVFISVNGTPCFLGAEVVNVRVIQGNCYKIRLGGNLGDTPAGNLTITMHPCQDDCNNNQLCDECEVSCFTYGCEFSLGCGTAIDSNGNGIPDECEPGVALIDKAPACDASLPKLRNNVVRLTFDNPIVAPRPGQILIQSLGAGGTFGPDLSANFTFSVEPGNVLRIRDNASTLANTTWYAIRNTGGWSGVDVFEVDYVVVIGDSDNTSLNDFADLSFTFANLTTAVVLDDNRSDVNSDTFVDFADISDAFGYNGSSVPDKPSGHECPK